MVCRDLYWEVIMLIQRREYMQKLVDFKDKQLIKVVTGVRRCGKSTLLKMYREWLLQNGVERERIIDVNFENMDFEALTDYCVLYQWLKDKLVPGKMTYIFLDEVQNVAHFQKVVDSLYIRENVDIYITGSNGYMLSDKLATLLSGRYIQIKMLPFSFSEYIEARDGATADSIDSMGDMSSMSGINSVTNKAVRYAEYLQDSSFPYALALREKPDLLRDYLEGIYNTIVVKDIIAHRKIADAMMLKSLLRFVFDNIGNPLSSKKIADTMTSAGRKIDVRTVERYLEALTESYIIYPAGRFDIKGKEYLKTLSKYYVVDIGLRFMLLGSSRQADLGHILENVVYLELLRRGYEVYVGKLNALEIDFVAKNSAGMSYYQAALTVRDERILARELRPLQLIKDNHPKYLLTMDDDPVMNYDGIRQLNARDWLLKLV